MPYVGVKDSGIDREGLKYAMDEMTEGKLIVYITLESSSLVPLHK